MIRVILGSLAFLGAAAVAHADVPGPQPITQYETPTEAMWAPLPTSLPKCDDSGVLSTVMSRFGETERTFWGGTSAITAIDEVRDIGFRANGLAYTPRRFCVARAEVVDPRASSPEHPEGHTVIYNVVSAGGMIGWTWGVQWCVVGFDRNRAYEPDCAVLRPILERWLGEQPGVVKARY